MDAILSNLGEFLCSLDGAALVIAVIVALAIPIFVGIMAIIGAWRIRQKGFRSGIFMIIPLILLGGALLWVNYKANGNSWDSEMLLMFLIYGFILMLFLLSGGSVLISKKEIGPVIVGILLLLAAAALFIFVYLPIIIEIYETLKLLTGIIIILFVVSGVKIIFL